MQELLKKQNELLARQVGLLESLVAQQNAFHFALPTLLEITDANKLNSYANLYEEYFKLKFNSISPISFDAYQKIL